MRPEMTDTPRLFPWFTVLGLLVGGLVVAAFYKDQFREWKTWQRKYTAMELARAATPEQRAEAARLPIEIRQIVLTDPDRVDRYIEKSIIEIAPIAFMRGRTLNDAFVILDEAQNTTSEQMKMFLTRLGFNSKAVVTGDVTQIDLPSGRRSGLVEAVEVVGKVEGISIIYFTERDVVRHSLVQRVIRAYEEYEQGRAAKANGEQK